MLVLSRKIGEEIVIGAGVTVRVARLSRSQVALAIDAPRSVSVVRKEILRCDHRKALDGLAYSADRAETASLRSIINCLVADSRTRYTPVIEFCDNLDGNEFRPELQSAIVSIVRELLLNACRHSKSKNVLLGLTQDNGCLYVQVQDWGVGFDPTSVPSHKRGLKAIRDLAGWLGGAARVESQNKAGTCVIVEIPLSQETMPAKPALQRRPR